MASEWPTTTLSKIAKLRSGFPFKSSSWQEQGIPVIKIANVKGGRINLEGCGYVSSEIASTIPEWMTRDGDLLIAMTGYVGELAMVRARERYLINQRVGRFEFVEGSPISPTYLFYYLQMPEIRAAIEEMARGSAQPNLSASDASRLEVPVAPEHVQAAVSDLGRAIDDRIDNLRQTNATLEAIAQTLFKSWFVDFDPVRAKAEGREPEGMDAATAALFPDEFEDSELGPIPKGWRTESFEREFDFTMGQSPPGSTYNQDGVGVPFFQGSTDFGDVFPAERVFCTEPARFARAGDLLMSVRAPVGALNIANIECSIGRGLCAIRHKSGSTGFTKQSIQACLTRIENAAGEGALFKSLSKKQLADLPVVVADSPVVDAMISLLEPLAARQIVGARQAQRFAQLRDTLLPRLISGKLRLPEAEWEVEAATA